MTYKLKSRIVTYAMPVAVIGLFSVIGLHLTHALFAQTPPPAQVGITLPQSQYRVGDDVIVTLSNSSSTDAYVVNNCPGNPLNVSYESGGGWQPVSEDAASSKCAGEPHDYKIPADSSVRVDYKYWPKLFSRPGTYRIQAGIEPDQQGPSVEFTVAD